MRIRRERHLACELLEEKTLLSGLSPRDTEALQEIASINNMGMFLSQLALLENVPAGVKQNASIVLTDGRNLDLSIHELASSKGTIVPSDIDSTDEPIAKHVLDEVGKSDFTRTYLESLDLTETLLYGELSHESTAASDASLKLLARNSVPLVSSDLTAVDQLETNNGSGSGTGGRTVPSGSPHSSTLNSTDLSILATSYSTTLMERFLAQTTAIETSNENVRLYAEKLIDDHEQEAIQIGEYAKATQTYLPAWVRGSDVQTSQHVLSALNKPSYDTTYLTTMVQSHTKDIQDNQNTLKTTNNPTLLQFAMDDIPTDWMHRAAAQYLLTQIK